jgi:hypothetical protein
MRHLSKEQIAGATLIGAFFFLYGEIEMMVPPMILINPLLRHKSLQFMCIILQQDQQNFVSERERERESKPQKDCGPRYTGEVQL